MVHESLSGSHLMFRHVGFMRIKRHVGHCLGIIFHVASDVLCRHVAQVEVQVEMGQMLGTR